MREDVRIDGTETLALHHLYRAMAVLEAHKDAVKQALYFRLAHRCNLAVELIFYDTTSLHFDAAKRRAEARLDGKFVIHSNDDSLTPTDLALSYKQLQRVEEA